MKRTAGCRAIFGVFAFMFLATTASAVKDGFMELEVLDIELTVFKNDSLEIDFSQHIFTPEAVGAPGEFILEQGTQNGWLEDTGSGVFIYRPEQGFVGRDQFSGLWRIKTEKQASRLVEVFISVKEPGLLAHWDFNDGKGTMARDVSGNGYHGFLINGPRWERGALRFARAFDHVEVPAYDAFTFMSSEDYTLVLRAWVVTPTQNWSGVFTRGREVGGWNGLWLTPDGQWSYAHAGGNVVGGSAQSGQWMHVVAVYENKVQKLYVNGGMVGQSSRYESGAERSPIWFGGAKSVSEFAEITLDEARIYNFAMSDSQINELYNTSIAREGGGLRRDYWLGVKGGSISDLTNFERYPTMPSGSDMVRNAESVNWYDPSDNHTWDDDYGERLHGWLRPPLTGQYVFYIAGDDACQLFLSTDDTDENLRLIAEVPDWTPHRFWKKHPVQQSAPITLDSKMLYRIVILHKEAGDGDHVSVGWLKPGDSGNYPSEIIPSSALKPDKD